VKDNNNADHQNQGFVSEDEAKLLEQLRANPLMAEQFGQLMDRFEQEVSSGLDAHQAEEMAIEELQQLGRMMLSQWTDKTHHEAIEQAKHDDPSLVGHGKKNSSGIAPSEGSA
jgi:hypothetical protein